VKIAKRFVVAADALRVWAFMHSPTDVGACIPGCHDVVILAPGCYRAAIRVQVGPIKTTFAVRIETTSERAPEFAEYLTQGEEGGRASRLSAVSSLAVTALPDGRSEVAYQSDINVVGRLGKFGAGVMQKIADNLGERFVTALRERLELPDA
jgi:carbon monoxide dehydrogenase subunit G